MSKIESLKPPHTIECADQAMELVRIWIVDGRQDVTISGNLWDDPAAWGLLLVDLAKHVANAYSQNGHDKAQVFNRIIEGFHAEIESATDDPSAIE